MQVVFNESEQEAMDKLLSVMDTILNDWGLQKDSNLPYELTLSIHALQGFITQHMLQRLNPNEWGEWYKNV